MQVFEQFQSRGSYLRPQLMGIIVTCQQVVFRLKDMQDWSALQNGTFVKNNVSFNFEDKIKDIIQGLKMKARFKNVALNVEFNFKA